MTEKENQSTYKGVRIGDTADWRLTLSIGRFGMGAWLKNEEDPTEPVFNLFREEWNGEEDGLLSKIEGCVYDNPQVLDDFSTDIVLTAPRTVWVPSEDLDEFGSEYELYNKVYKAEEEDIFTDETAGISCMYTLVAGLRPFIMRTLPGARVLNHQSICVNRFMERGSDLPRIYIDIRKTEADFYVLDDKKLLLSVTYPWRVVEDLAYHAFNIADIYRLRPDTCQVSLSGIKEVRHNLTTLMRKYMAYVMNTMLPSNLSKEELPMAVAMVMSRKKKGI